MDVDSGFLSLIAMQAGGRVSTWYVSLIPCVHWDCHYFLGSAVSRGEGAVFVILDFYFRGAAISDSESDAEVGQQRSGTMTGFVFGIQV